MANSQVELITAGASEVRVAGAGWINEDGALSTHRLFSFDALPLYRKTGGGALRQKSYFAGVQPGYVVQDWQPDPTVGLSAEPTISFRVRAVFKWLGAAFNTAGIIVGGDNLYRSGVRYYLAYSGTWFHRSDKLRRKGGASTSTTVRNCTSNPTANTYFEVVGEANVVSGVTTPTMTFKYRRLDSYTDDTTFTPNAEGWVTNPDTVQLSTIDWTVSDPLRVGFFINSSSDQVELVRWECTAGAKKTLTRPSNPFILANIADSNAEYKPVDDATNLWAAISPMAALELVAAGLIPYDGVEMPIGPGNSGWWAKRWDNPAGAEGSSQYYASLSLQFLLDNVVPTAHYVKYGTGTNDVRSSQTPVAYTPAQIATNIQSVHDKVRAVRSTIKMLFQAPPDIGPAASGYLAQWNTDLATLRPLISTVAAGNANNTYLDLKTVGVDSAPSSDDIHYAWTSAEARKAVNAEKTIIQALFGVAYVPSITEGATATVLAGRTLTLHATATPSDGYESFTWSVQSGTGTLSGTSGGSTIFTAPEVGATDKTTVVRVATQNGSYAQITITTPAAGASSEGGFDMSYVISSYYPLTANVLPPIDKIQSAIGTDIGTSGVYTYLTLDGIIDTRTFNAGFDPTVMAKLISGAGVARLAIGR